MSFLYINNIYFVLFQLLVTFSGIQCELCNVLDDQGETDKIYCKIGCCGSLEDSYCCIEDSSAFDSYYYGYRVAGAVVGFIFGLIALIVAVRCIYAIYRDRTVYVTTVEPGEDGDITVTTTGAEQDEPRDIPMQRPAAISYSEETSILYEDHENSDEQKLVK